MSNEFQKIEYDNLYKEILANSGKVYAVLNICVTVTASFIGYLLTRGITIWSPFLLLVPFSVILPSIKSITASLSSTVRIAGYLMIFYEEEYGGILWQSKMQEFRKRNDSKKLRFFGKSLQTIFYFLGLTCILLSVALLIYEFDFWLVIWEGKPEILGLISLCYILLLVASIYFWLKLTKLLGKTLSYEYFSELREIWDNIKKGKDPLL